MKGFVVGVMCLLTSVTAFSKIVEVKVADAVTDENIKQTIIIFADYKDAINQKSECDTDSTEVPAFVVIDNNLISACWEPARTDGIGYISYTNQSERSEISFNERVIKFKSVKLDTVKKKLLP